MDVSQAGGDGGSVAVGQTAGRWQGMQLPSANWSYANCGEQRNRTCGTHGATLTARVGQSGDEYVSSVFLTSGWLRYDQV
jgi:hypothetical protein